MIKLIITDLDGVLIDSKEIHYLALNKALAEIDVKYVISEDEHISKFDGLPTTQKLNILTSEKGLDINLHVDISNKKQIYTHELLLNNVKYDNRLVSIFKKLKKDGYVIYVASNAVKNTVHTILDKKGLLPYIKSYMTNNDVINPKPSSEIYLQIMIKENIKPCETLIVEDSIIGLESAFGSGANVCVVKNSLDFTLDKIEEHLNRETNNNTKWYDKKLNIIVPMAGNGSRFIEGGYINPKPLINIHNKPMIKHVYDNLNIDCNFIYIVKKEHYEKYNLEMILNVMTPNCKIITVDKTTEGAACTALLAKEYINNVNPLIIANSDQFIEWDSFKFYQKFLYTELDGIILTFKSNESKWSYVKVNEFNNVTEVREKEVISDIATVGIYGYKKGSEFVKYAEQMIYKNIRVNNEYYICPIYNEYIADNKIVKTYKVDKMWGLGTPSDLSDFIYKYNANI